MAITNTPSLVLALGLVAYLLHKYLIQPVFLSPLAQVPAAHWSASFSELWILWIRYSSRENRTIFEAHRRHGPVVRLGPNEISVNSSEGLRAIYVGGFEKHIWYSNMFANYDDVPTMFSTVQSKPHSQRKRMLSNVYSKSTLQSSPTLQAISSHIVFKRFLPEIVKHKDEPIDVHFLFNRVTMDMVTAYMFGLRNGTNFIHNVDVARQWLHWFHCRRPFAFWVGEMPSVLQWAKLLGLRRLVSPPFVKEANDGLEEHCLAMLDAALEDAEHPELESSQPENVPIVIKQLSEALHEQVGKPTSMPLHPTAPLRMQLASEAIDQLGAGHETSSITLTYLFWELAKDRNLQQDLRDEVLTLSPAICDPVDSTTAKLPESRSIDALPLLHAILMETLRCHPAIPGPEPRVTPAGASLCGLRNLPAGIRVSCSPYSLHRDGKVFQDPGAFVPERWLPASPDDDSAKTRLAEQYRWFWSFSSGGRMCIGSNLAMQEMKLITASIFSNWRVEIVDDVGIEQEDAYTAQPVRQKLLLRFETWHASQTS